MTVIFPFSTADDSGTVCPMAHRKSCGLMTMGETGNILSLEFSAIDEPEASGADYCIIEAGDDVDKEIFTAYGLPLLEAPRGADIDELHDGLLFRQLKEVV